MMFGSLRRVRKNQPLTSSSRRGRDTPPSWHRRLVRGLCVTGLAGAVCVGVWQYPRLVQTAEQWTAIEHVTILGENHLSRAEVLAQLQLPPQASLSNVDVDELAARVEAHPWVRQASVRRVFLHTLAVDVEERAAAAVWSSARGRYVIDDEGYRLMKVDGQSETHLPVVSGLPEASFDAPDHVSRQQAHRGIQIATLIKKTLNVVPTVKIQGDSVVIADISKTRFQFGSDTPAQWQRFVALYPSIKTNMDREATEVDLRYSGKVILRKRES